MRILITGGFGFVGGRLAQRLESAGHEVMLGSRQADSLAHLMPEVQAVATPWEDPAALRRLCDGIDLLVHAAGMNAQDCSADPVAALQFNGVATARLIGATANSRIKRIIYLSTAHVYSNPLAGRIDEDTCPRNSHAYASSHLAGENAVLDMRAGARCERIVLRLSNIFGTPVTPVVNCWSLLVNDLCRQAVTSRTMLLRTAGLQQRDFMPMDAFLDVFETQFAAEAGAPLGGVFNMGSGMSLSVLQMAQKIQERCQAVLGFEPGLQTQAGASREEENTFLEYRSKRLPQMHMPNMNAEIDGLLVFCNSVFGHPGRQ